MYKKSSIQAAEAWCGICQYVCTVGAIDWSYPEAGTGVVLKWS
jgi:ferredoxin-like protein FixX